MSKVCEACSKNFEPWDETICMDCQEEFSQDISVSYAQLKHQADQMREALDKIKDVEFLLEYNTLEGSHSLNEKVEYIIEKAISTYEAFLKGMEK